MKKIIFTILMFMTFAVQARSYVPPPYIALEIQNYQDVQCSEMYHPITYLQYTWVCVCVCCEYNSATYNIWILVE